MSRRIDVELTSARADGTWTWRAAGAREPKGELQGTILPADAKVGAVLRVDAEFEIDGITILSVVPSKAPRKEAERLELVGGDTPFELVTTRLAERGRGERRPRRDGEGDDRPRGDRNRGDRPRGPRPEGDRPRGPRPEGERSGPGGPGGPRGDRPGGRPGGDRPGADRRGPRPGQGEGGERPRRTPAPAAPAAPPKPKARRLRPGRTHRTEVMASLPEEQRPVAEQVLRGGLPAVRAAVEEQNAALKAEGKPEIRAGALVALAEELLPRLRAAEWLDRAEAALADADEVDLRDLRSVVSAANDVARVEATRELASQLREALNRRVDKEHNDWLAEVGTALTEGRSVRALRMSSRPPKAGSRFPADLAGKLAEAASSSLTPEASAERWVAVLDALSLSPVRSFVVPAGIPSPVTAELTEAVTRFAPQLPEIAALFGIEAPAQGSRAARGPRRPPQGRRPPRPPRPDGGEAAPAAEGSAPTEELPTTAVPTSSTSAAEATEATATEGIDAPTPEAEATATEATATEGIDAPTPEAEATATEATATEGIDAPTPEAEAPAGDVASAVAEEAPAAEASEPEAAPTPEAPAAEASEPEAAPTPEAPAAEASEPEPHPPAAEASEPSPAEEAATELIGEAAAEEPSGQADQA